MFRTIGSAAMLLIPLSGLAYANAIGHWEGSATRDGRSTPVILDLHNGSGTVGLPGLEVLGIPVEFEADQSPLSCEFQSGGSTHRFELTPTGEQLNGTWSVEGSQTRLELQLERAVDSRPYTSEAITFHSDIKLAGTVFVPKSPGPHAGIALIHGSGDNERWWREYYADFFARQGLAVVFFDKRGNAGSEGNWRDVGFEPLARDGLAALDYLASRPDIRQDALGFWGISQAGWIMPLAATLSDRVSFIVVTSGSTTPVEDEGYYDYMVQLKDLGYGEEVRQKMLDILKFDNHVTRTGEGYEELKAMVEPVRQEPWFRQSGFLATPPNFVLRRFYRLILDFDPQSIIRQLDIPVLWLYGDEDKSVDTPVCIGILEDIAKEGDYEFTIRSFQEADHGITVPVEPGAIVPKRLAAPGYWDTIAAWLDQQGLSRSNAE
jgi:hypothetical protein